MYKKLLISSGGGIISVDQQGEQDNCVTIAIGLGGTGISCLKTLKQEVYNRVKPDNENSAVPEYKHFKFLALDTDRKSVDAGDTLDAIDPVKEFFDISCPDINGLLKDAYLLRQKPTLKWLKAESTESKGGGIKILSAEAGAGGVRQIGRLLLIQNSAQFVNKLTTMITEAQRGLTQPSINIHIFTGLAGGTGAGTFLDVCYIVQHVLDTLGIGGRALTCGYFFLPDINIDKHPLPYLQANGFAAMKELDYCMNYSHNGGKWNQQYEGFDIETTSPPVKIAHLITAKDQDGNVKDDGYDYAMHVVTDYVMEFIIKQEQQAGLSQPALQSHLSNVETIKRHVTIDHGGCYDYCVLGASNAYMPYREINTYLAAKIFEGFAGIEKRTPTDAEVERFIFDNQLRYEDLRIELEKEVPTIPYYEVDTDLLCDQTEGITDDQIPQVLMQMRDELSHVVGKLAENKNAMLEEITTTGAGAQLSLQSRIKNVLIDRFAANPEFGPFYACAILKNDENRDLKNRIVNYKRTQENDYSNALADLELRRQEQTEALRYLQNARGGFLGKKKKAGAYYVQCVHSYYIQRAKVEQLRELGELLSELEKQLTKMHTGFFLKFVRVIRELQETFRNNLVQLSDIKPDTSGYAKRIVSIQEMQPILDKTVASMDIGGQLESLVKDLISEPETWIENDEDSITSVVTRHFLETLSDYTSKSMIDYLREKYNHPTAAILTSTIEKQIIQPLDTESAPLFWLGKGYQINPQCVAGYISIPNSAQEIINAAQNFVAGHAEIELRTSYSDDRISLFKFICGVPLFGYKGVENDRGAYKVSKNVGAHIYEGAEEDERDSRKLVDIAPVSVRNPSEWTEEEKTYVANYDKAIELGVISSTMIGNVAEYSILIIDKDKLDDLTNKAADAIQSGDANAATQLLDQYGAIENVQKSRRVISNDGGDGFEETVVRDHVISSERNNKIVEEQNELLGTYRETIAELERMVSTAEILQDAIPDFADAFATGVIKKKSPFEYVVMLDVSGLGISEEFQLTTVETEPFGKHIPIYSAFKGFVELGSEKRDLIKEAAMKALGSVESMKESLDAAEKDLSEDKIASMKATAKRNYPEEEAKITGLLLSMLEFINNYKSQF